MDLESIARIFAFHNNNNMNSETHQLVQEMCEAITQELEVIDNIYADEGVVVQTAEVTEVPRYSLCETPKPTAGGKGKKSKVVEVD